MSVIRQCISFLFMATILVGCQEYLSDEALNKDYYKAAANEDWQKAVEVLTIKISRHPEEADFYLQRALALSSLEASNLDAIIQDYASCLQITEDYRVRFLRAIAFFKNEQYSEANADLDFLINNVGALPILVLWKANSAYAATNFKVAQELYEYRYKQEGDYETLNEAYKQSIRSKYFSGDKEGASWDVAFTQDRGFTEDTVFSKRVITAKLESSFAIEVPEYSFEEIGQFLSSQCATIDILWNENWYKPKIFERLYKVETPDDVSELLPNRLDVIRLNISYRNLREFPKVIQQFKNLQEIDISGNRFNDLENVCAHLAALPNLKVLKMDRSNLKVFPKNFDYLTNLEVLSLEASNIRELPESIGSFSHLRFLSVRNNGRLSDLPSNVGSLSCLEYLDVSGSGMQRLRDELSGCTSLRSITANAAKIKTLPNEIGNLTQLTFLNLAANKIHELPMSFGNLVNLKDCSLGSNELQRLPPTFSKLKNLYSCGLDFNRFKTFPKEVLSLNLHSLWLHNSSFSEIPVEIGKLPKLKYLLVDHEIITDQNIEDIKDLNPNLRVIREDSRKYVKGKKRKI